MSMALHAKLQEDARAADRHDLGADATLRAVDDSPLDILIANLSATGCLFVCSERLEVDGAVTIGIAGLGRLPARIVRAEGQRYGANFDRLLDAAELNAALALSDDTVIQFPIGLLNVPIVNNDLPPIAKLPLRTRAAVLAALTLGTWSAVLAISWCFVELL